MKRRFALLALMAPALALAYPIDVRVVTRGLDVGAESIQQGNATILHLINHEPVALRCEVLFDAGAESRRRTTLLDPGGRKTVRYDPLREVVRMTVRIDCMPSALEQGDEGKGAEGQEGEDR
jgi:hypothetical protein